MNVLQIILIALFIYLGSIGSIVGNTIGVQTEVLAYSSFYISHKPALL